MTMRIVESLSRLFHVCQGGMCEHLCLCGGNLHVSNATERADTRIGQHDRDMPDLVGSVELGLVSGEPIGQVVAEEKIRRGLSLQGRDLRCPVEAIRWILQSSMFV